MTEKAAPTRTTPLSSGVHTTQFLAFRRHRALALEPSAFTHCVCTRAGPRTLHCTTHGGAPLPSRAAGLGQLAAALRSGVRGRRRRLQHAHGVGVTLRWHQRAGGRVLLLRLEKRVREGWRERLLASQSKGNALTLSRIARKRFVMWSSEIASAPQFSRMLAMARSK